MKKFTYFYVMTHPDRVLDNVTLVVRAEDRETADSSVSQSKKDYVHLLNVTEEDIGDAPGMTRESRRLPPKS